MGLISRVSSRTYRYSPWDDDQPDATEVSQTLKSEFSISVTSEPTSWPSQSTSLWSPTSTNRSVLRLSKPPVSVPTSTWPRCAVRTLSTCESELTRTTSLESTRCCRAQAPIVCKPVCEERTVSPINIGDPILSIRTKEANFAHAYEALRRSKMTFPGRQKIYRSKNWGFTKFTTEKFGEFMRDGKIYPDGNSCQYKGSKGPLKAWMDRQSE